MIDDNEEVADNYENSVDDEHRSPIFEDMVGLVFTHSCTTFDLQVCEDIEAFSFQLGRVYGVNKSPMV